MEPALHRVWMKLGRQTEIEVPKNAHITGAAQLGPVLFALYMTVDKQQQGAEMRRFVLVTNSQAIGEDQLAMTKFAAPVTLDGKPTTFSVLEVTR